MSARLAPRRMQEGEMMKTSYGSFRSFPNPWWLGFLALAFLGACATSGTSGNVPDDSSVDIGYGSAEKEHVVGSMAEIDGNNNAGVRYRTIGEMLEGQPGVFVREFSGGRISMRIRGSNSFLGGEEPLFVLDGMALHSPDGLVGLSPADVETITVLKDAASTAIYGSRGANGVILIKTKRYKGGGGSP